MRTVMDHSFSHVPPIKLQRSKFDRTRGLKTTIGPADQQTSDLYPIFCDEILPGDTVSMDATFMARLSTLIFPIMDNLFFETFWFFVPNRLVWDHWEAFIAGNDDPDETPPEYELPVVSGDPFTCTSGSIYDYFGLPIGQYDADDQLANADVQPIALPLRAYNLIWNEWFRPEYIKNKVNVPKDDGPDGDTDYFLLPRAKRHDYFTSCLPWPQKGDAISLPLGTEAPVIGNGDTVTFTSGSNLQYGLQYSQRTSFDAILEVSGNSDGTAAGTAAAVTGFPNDTGKTLGLSENPALSGMIADLSAATAATVNELRRAFLFQELLEIDARAGSRYIESIEGHFGVRPADYRLQRPEYLGGSSQRIDVRAVAQTSESGTTKQGNLAAFAQVSDRCFWNKSFVEHGFVIGLANVRADITYQQGLDRMWTRRTRFDHYFPALAHLGEQAVYQKEIFFTPVAGGSPAANATVFGYQERWSEYRYGISRVTGLFRSDVANSLDEWHLALDFPAAPQLDSVFIDDFPPISRVIAVTQQNPLILDAFFKTHWSRVMPVYSVPARLGRF